MYCYTKKNLAWIKIPKNACSSWEHALSNDGWALENLSDYQGRWQEMQWFGFIRDPYVRHTMGISQFLSNNRMTSILDNEDYAKLICAGFWDEHCYTIHHLVPYELIQLTNWFVLDFTPDNYEEHTRNFCNAHGVGLPAIQRFGVSGSLIKEQRKRICLLYTSDAADE